MSEEIDLHQLIELIDAALTSKDANVQKALRKFLFIAALALDNGEEREMGPIEKILTDLEARVGSLERDRWNRASSKDDLYGPAPWTTTPWTTIGGGTAGGWGSGTILCSDGSPTITTTTTSYIDAMKNALQDLDQYKSYAIQSKLAEKS
jgi:hypothetical protein